jgi:hypothetical protein
VTRTIELVVVVVIAALAACTSDLDLGSRPCDRNTTPCACTGTPECPNDYYCLRDNNAEQGQCVLGTTCDNANTCNDVTLACCAIDHVCYPTTCVDCCE